MSLAWKGNPLTPGLLFIPIQALYKGLECGISVKDCTLSHLPFHGGTAEFGKNRTLS
ncbi:hypothetical protein MUTS8_46710 (plasmid) [Escherichia coli]|nr:hypothetical protein MUTS8_46710 [Escherichia coli]